MDRRSFLGSILTACVAPAIVRADSLMRVIPRETTVVITGVDPGTMDGTYLLQGEIGSWEGIRIIRPADYLPPGRTRSQQLALLTGLKKETNLVFVHPSDYVDLKGLR